LRLEIIEMQWKTLGSLVKENTRDDSVTIPKHLFRQLLIAALKSKGVFDEEYYRAFNKDISDAIVAGNITCGADHYFEAGYFEGRQPRKLIVDEKYYLEQNPDVARAIRGGVIENAQQHFEYCGFKEGRSPYEGFELF
jgi:hypothetical protein